MAPIVPLALLLSCLSPHDAPAPALPMPGPATERARPGDPRPRAHEARKLKRPRREPEDWALMLPRAVLYLPRFALTGVFTPVSRTLALVDDRRVARVARVFLWNRKQTIGWTPVLAWISGYGFTAGARVFHKDLFHNDEVLSIEGGVGGIHAQAYELRFHGDTIGGSHVWIDSRVRYDMSPRLVFQGIGVPEPQPPDGDRLDPRGGDIRTRYSQDRVLAAVRVGYRIGRPHRAVLPGIGVVFNHRTFGPARAPQQVPFGNIDPADRSTEQVYDVDQLTGFRSGVDVARLSARLAVDFRDDPIRTSRGFFWLIEGGGAPPQARNVAYAHYGSELLGFVSVFTPTRVFALRVALEAVHGEDSRIPFSELPRLGGPLRLRGYRLNRFRDQKTLLGTLEYRYPIHHMLAGHLFVDVGRVAKSYRELFAAEAAPWHVGYGGGLTFMLETVRMKRALWFRIDLTYGEEFMVFFSTDPLQAFADKHLLEL